LFASEVEDLSFSLLRYGRGEDGCLHQQNRKNLRHDRLERWKKEEKKSETIWLVVKDLQVRIETKFWPKRRGTVVEVTMFQLSSCARD
jgi:hypothetical protein